MNTEITVDAQLLSRARSGDSAAFCRLAELYAARLAACAFQLCRDHHRAEDLTQETFIEAWRSLARFDGRCQFSTWLYGILRHRYLKSWRRLQLDTSSDADQRIQQVESSSDVAPTTAAEKAEDSTRVRRAVAELPEEHRLVIELRFFADSSLEEIAAALDCPLGTVKSRLHHGLEKLRKQNFFVNLFQVERESVSRQP